MHADHGFCIHEEDVALLLEGVTPPPYARMEEDASDPALLVRRCYDEQGKLVRRYAFDRDEGVQLDLYYTENGHAIHFSGWTCRAVKPASPHYPCALIHLRDWAILSPDGKKEYFRRDSAAYDENGAKKDVDSWDKYPAGLPE